MADEGGGPRVLPTIRGHLRLPSTLPTAWSPTISSAIFEDASNEKPKESNNSYVQRINQQLAGIDELDGSYSFTLGRSVKACRLNNFLHGLIESEQRQLFQHDQEAAFEQAGLTWKSGKWSGLGTGERCRKAAHISLM